MYKRYHSFFMCFESLSILLCQIVRTFSLHHYWGFPQRGGSVQGLSGPHQLIVPACTIHLALGLCISCLSRHKNPSLLVPDAVESYIATPVGCNYFLQHHLSLWCSCVSCVFVAVRSEALLPNQHTHPNLSVHCSLQKAGRAASCLQEASDSCPTTSSETRRK